MNQQHIYVEFVQLLTNPNISSNIKKWKSFELLCQLEYDCVKPRGKDYGVDLQNVATQTYYQCKNWTSSICYSQLSTFLAYAFINDYKNLVLLYTCDKQIIPIKPIGDKIKYVKVDEMLLLQKWKSEICKFMAECGNYFTDTSQSITYLRQCQVECLKVMEGDVENDVMNLQMYCGTGKSIVFREFVLRHKEQKTLILVPSRILLNQMYELFKDFIHEIQMFGDNNDVEVQDGTMLMLCIYNSVHYVEEVEFDYVIVDEAHHITKDTVYDEDDVEDDEEENYITTIQHNLSYDRIFNFSATLNQTTLDYNYDLQCAIRDKIVVDYNIYITLFRGDLINVNFNECINTSSLKCLIYCSRIETCEKLAKILDCDYLSGDMSQSVRENVITRFRMCKRFLISVRTLSEGVNLTFVDSCMFFDDDGSDRSIIQKVGRCQRVWKGKKWCDVYLFQEVGGDYQEKLGKYCQAFSEYDKDVKRKICVRGERWMMREVVDDVMNAECEVVGQVVEKNCSRFMWSLEEKYQMCRTWLRDNGGKLPPQKLIVNGFKIGGWFDNMKRGQNGKYKQLLEQEFHILITFDKTKTNKQYSLDEKYQIARNYLTQSGGKLPPWKLIVNNFKLGEWFYDMKRGRTIKYKQLLEQEFHILITCCDKQYSLDEKYQICLTWLKDNVGKSPQRSLVINGFKIGQWFDKLKQGRCKEYKQKLEAEFGIIIACGKK